MTLRFLLHRAWYGCSILLIVLFAPSEARAQQTTWTYIGPPFTSFAGGLTTGGLTTSNFLTFTVSWAGDPGSGALSSFWASDGVHTTSSAAGGYGQCIVIAYSPSGDLPPAAWNCDFYTPNGADYFTFHSASNGIYYQSDFSQGPFISPGYSWYASDGGGGSWTSGAGITSLSASPTSQTIRAGKSASYTITAQPVSGVQLECLGEPLASTCTVTSGPNGTFVATIDTSPGKKGTPKGGNYTITFRASLATSSRDTTVNLLVK